MADGQLTFGAAVALCNHGTPAFGEPRRCNEPATHAAVSHQRAYSCGGGTCDHRIALRLDAPEHVARVECCRRHADSVASAWAGINAHALRINPTSCRDNATAVWIEILDG